MKISKSFLFKTILVVGFILFSQLSFAIRSIPLPKDGQDTPPPYQPNGPDILLTASADISDTELAVYFEWGVGDATVTVYDESDNAIYQEAVDTGSTPEVYIPVGSWMSGTYMVTVTYGTTTQRGYFQLE